MRVEHQYFDDTKVQIIPVQNAGNSSDEAPDTVASKRNATAFQRNQRKPRKRYFVAFLLVVVMLGYFLAEQHNSKEKQMAMRRKKMTTPVPTGAPTPPSDNGGKSTSDTSSVGSPGSYFFSKASIRASEALVCRESVVAFVINATDGKDECDGLRRAFDKTCSNTELEGNDRRRRLAEKTQHLYRWQALLYRAQRAWRRFWRVPPVFFFAEDQIESEYEEATFLVEQGVDEMVHPDVRWRMERLARRRRQLQNLLANKSKTFMMDIPSANKQLGNQTASEALLLQQGEDYLVNAVNQSAVAVEDAKQSSKAVADANSAVASVLNDPSSKAARACCASILNVYHENCSTDEEEAISDLRLFFVVFILALCGMVKSLIRYYKIYWMPEAAGCILVGGTCQVRCRSCRMDQGMPSCQQQYISHFYS